ncbi:MAG: type I-U CRISPR-associated protein Csb2 [Bryobacteraceae bacterium]
MFALRVTYLMGRVYSAVFDDGDDKREPEWPPHPSRLFSALVAAWGDGGAEEELRPALKWLEEQAAPAICAGGATGRKLVQAFVPVNDARTLPEERPRKPRTFPSATLSHPDVYFVWNAPPPAAVLTALDDILKRTSSLGHSSSLVSVEIVDTVPEDHGTVWVPDAPQGDRMRIPHPGRLDELSERYKRFQIEPNKIHRPSLGRTTLYGSTHRTEPEIPQGVFDQMIVLRRDVGACCSLRSTLAVLSAFRGAMLALAPQPVPEYLSGHSPESTQENPVRSERPHVAVAPLPFVDAPHATGDLMGVAALLPKTLTQEEREACWGIISSIEELRMLWGPWKVSVTDAEEHRRTLRPETWTQPHTVWSTVTPFVFDRFPKDPYGQEAVEVVQEAFARVGLPKPCDLDLHYNPWHIGVPKASAFPPAPARSGKPQRYHCHVWARFDRPIAGPVIAGAGRYYGYGLFRPLLGRKDAP